MFIKEVIEKSKDRNFICEIVNNWLFPDISNIIVEYRGITLKISAHPHCSRELEPYINYFPNIISASNLIIINISKHLSIIGCMNQNFDYWHHYIGIGKNHYVHSDNNILLDTKNHIPTYITDNKSSKSVIIQANELNKSNLEKYFKLHLGIDHVEFTYFTVNTNYYDHNNLNNTNLYLIIYIIHDNVVSIQHSLLLSEEEYEEIISNCEYFKDWTGWPRDYSYVPEKQSSIFENISTIVLQNIIKWPLTRLGISK